MDLKVPTFYECQRMESVSEVRARWIGDVPPGRLKGIASNGVARLWGRAAVSMMEEAKIMVGINQRVKWVCKEVKARM
jgi:hypothetical protein